MKAKKLKLKHLFPLLKKYYFLLIIIACIGFVGAISFYKLYIKKPNFIYARVKVGQGYWWATTQKPNIWFVHAIQQARDEKDLTGKSIAKVIRVAYYPYYGSSQFDVFVTLRLKVDKTGSTGTYNFKRETIGVGGPIDLEFSNVQFSGVITQLSESPFPVRLIQKTVYLTKKFTYPWEYDGIKIGDSFNDGNSNVVQILDKAKGETNEVFINELGKLLSTETETYRYIILKVQIRVKEDKGVFLYGEETIISPGRIFGFVTNDFTFNDYVISKVE